MRAVPAFRGRRRARGAASLFAVFLLLALAAIWLAWEARIEDRERRRALARSQGQGLALALASAHRASQVDASLHAENLAASGGAGYELTAGALAAHLPPGLPADRPGLTLGILDDGGGVAMAFAVWETDDGPADAIDDLDDAIREGALAAGLRALATRGDTGAMAGHLPAIEAVLGRAMAPGALYATADLALAYREHLLHRRAQPGRPHLTHMAQPLDFAATHAIAGAGTVSAGSTRSDTLAVSGDLSAAGARGNAGLRATGLTTLGPLRVEAALTIGQAAGLTGETLAAGTVTADTIDAGALLGPDARIADSLAVGPGGCTGCE